MFRVMISYEDREQLAQLDCPTKVPWDMVAAHEKQAYSNHMQSLERLNSRGGLSPRELLAVLDDKPFFEGGYLHMPIEECVTRIKDHQRKDPSIRELLDLADKETWHAASPSEMQENPHFLAVVAQGEQAIAPLFELMKEQFSQNENGWMTFYALNKLVPDLLKDFPDEDAGKYGHLVSYIVWQGYCRGYLT